MKTRLGFVRDDRFLGHEPDAYHPECPDRLIAIGNAIDATPAFAGARIHAARPALSEELERAHDPRYVRTALATLKRGSGYFDGDTYFSEGTADAALGAAGGCIDAALALHRDESDVVMALPRPPGHHATRSRAMGFCIFNNIAVAARALAGAGVERTLILDWDVHHGNGTQAIFWDDPRVLFVSFHLWPHYPGSGLSEEVGEEEGAGFTVNFPFPHGTGNADFVDAIERVVAPIAAEYRPQRVLASTGFDGHRDDPLGGLALDEDGFRWLAWRLRDLARPTADGRTMMFLEGGYDLHALASSVVATVEGAIAERPVAAPDGPRHPGAKATIERTLAALRPHWKNLR